VARVNNTLVAELTWENREKDQKKPYYLRLIENDQESFF
jgi:hypothetical protein|tara:strand:- start:155 stop:271 length:117 start_codon:yes stop_codon:yes gene_type:complete